MNKPDLTSGRKVENEDVLCCHSRPAPHGTRRLDMHAGKRLRAWRRLLPAKMLGVLRQAQSGQRRVSVDLRKAVTVLTVALGHAYPAASLQGGRLFYTSFRNTVFAEALPSGSYQNDTLSGYMERNRAARGAKNAARVMALGAALLQSPVVPAFSQPLQTIERTVAQKLFDEIRDENLQKGTERIIQWAATLPYEVSVSRIEASKEETPGEWADLRGGDLLSVDIPHMGRRSAFMRRIVAFATKNNTKQVRACVTHTHVADYLRRLKSGKMSTNELRQLKRLGVVTRVPPSVDSRGYTDSLDADGPFGTPPSFTDLQSYKVFLAGMEESAYDEDIELDVVQSVTTALGVWYYRECNEGECAPPSGEFNLRNEKSREVNVSELQARWVLYVNKEKPSGADLIESDVHKSVVKGYEAHGFKVWFLPKEMVPRLKTCKGDIE